MTHEETLAYHRAYRAAHREKLREYHRAYHAANRDRINAANKARGRKPRTKQQRQYRETHRDKFREKNRQYYEEHTAQAKERAKIHYEANRDEIIAKRRRSVAELDDYYVRSTLLRMGQDCPQELIEAKRELIRLKRVLKREPQC